MIKIVFIDGDVISYDSDEYTTYEYDRKFFIIKYEEKWIGMYNIEYIKCIEVSKF